MTATMDSWSCTKVANAALRLEDVLHCIGPVVTFNAYWTQFCRDAKEITARRAWERLKSNWKAMGLRFELEDGEKEGYGPPIQHALMESTAHARQVVNSLIGPAIRPVGPKRTLRTIDDFFPGIDHKEVRDLMDALGEDLAA